MPLDETVKELSRMLLSLAPGPLAELRRMEVSGPPVPIFWRLATKCEFDKSNTDAWKQVVKILAILTPKGEKRPAYCLHDVKRGLGTVLCDGGDPGWRFQNDPPDGVFSEKRLARFLALPRAQRGPALERIARLLARTRDAASGINCTDIAALLLTGDNKDSLDRIARDYYRRLDRPAARDAETVSKETEEGTD